MQGTVTSHRQVKLLAVKRSMIREIYNILKAIKIILWCMATEPYLANGLAIMTKFSWPFSVLPEKCGVSTKITVATSFHILSSSLLTDHCAFEAIYSKLQT
jgi:hypothetical protein